MWANPTFSCSIISFTTILLVNGPTIAVGFTSLHVRFPCPSALQTLHLYLCLEHGTFLSACGSSSAAFPLPSMTVCSLPKILGSWEANNWVWTFWFVLPYGGWSSNITATWRMYWPLRIHTCSILCNTLSELTLIARPAHGSTALGWKLWMTGESFYCNTKAAMLHSRRIQ